MYNPLIQNSITTVLSTPTIPFQSRWLNYIHYTHYTLFIKIYIYKQGFSRFRFCKIFVHPDGMKFSRMLPRPLETFHSVDEKRPRITFTKIHSGGFSTFSSREAARSFFFFFFLPSPSSRGIQFYGSSFEKEKKKKEESPTSPSLSRIERGEQEDDRMEGKERVEKK